MLSELKLAHKKPLIHIRKENAHVVNLERTEGAQEILNTHMVR